MSQEKSLDLSVNCILSLLENYGSVVITKHFIFLLLISYGGYQWYVSSNNPEGSYGVRHYELIKYSLTACSSCKAKVRELDREVIEFTEYYMDEDISKRDELTEKLAAAGYKKVTTVCLYLMYMELCYPIIPA